MVKGKKQNILVRLLKKIWSMGTFAPLVIWKTFKEGKKVKQVLDVNRCIVRYIDQNNMVENEHEGIVRGKDVQIPLLEEQYELKKMYYTPKSEQLVYVRKGCPQTMDLGINEEDLRKLGYSLTNPISINYDFDFAKKTAQVVKTNLLEGISDVNYTMYIVMMFVGVVTGIALTLIMMFVFQFV